MFLKMLGSHYIRINWWLSYFSNTGEIKVFVCKPDFNIAIFPGEKMISFVVQWVKSMCLSIWLPTSKEWGKFFPFILYLRLLIKQACLKGNGLKDNGQTSIKPVSEELRNCGISFGKLSAGDKTTSINVTYLRSTPYWRQEKERLSILKMIALILLILAILQPFSEGRYRTVFARWTSLQTYKCQTRWLLFARGIQWVFSLSVTFLHFPPDKNYFKRCMLKQFNTADN